MPRIDRVHAGQLVLDAAPGAPMKPAAVPMPSISSHRGQLLRRIGIERAVDHESRHLLHDVREIEIGDAIALEIRRRIEVVDRIRHAVAASANSIVFIS